MLALKVMKYAKYTFNNQLYEKNKHVLVLSGLCLVSSNEDPNKVSSFSRAYSFSRTVRRGYTELRGINDYSDNFLIEML